MQYKSNNREMDKGTLGPTLSMGRKQRRGPACRSYCGIVTVPHHLIASIEEITTYSFTFLFCHSALTHGYIPAEKKKENHP